MYNHMVVHRAAADLVFQALSDGTRRDIMRRANRKPHSVSELASSYDMSFAAVQKHVAVLERAGLVTKHRRGRERLVTGDIEALRIARLQLDELEEIWQGRLERFGELLTEPMEGDEQ